MELDSINTEQGPYVLRSGDGFSRCGFAVAERKRRAPVTKPMRARTPKRAASAALLSTLFPSFPDARFGRNEIRSTMYLVDVKHGSASTGATRTAALTSIDPSWHIDDRCPRDGRDPLLRIHPPRRA